VEEEEEEEEEEKMRQKATHHLVMLVSKLLAHELAHPIVTRVSVFGLQTGDYERHLVLCYSSTVVFM
jgi:hypothetical protein